MGMEGGELEGAKVVETKKLLASSGSWKSDPFASTTTTTTTTTMGKKDRKKTGKGKKQEQQEHGEGDSNGVAEKAVEAAL